MQAVKNALLGLPAQDINGDHWNGIVMAGEGGFVGYDEKDRAQFSATFRIWIEPALPAESYRDPL
jgi:hypothetical protein